MFLSAVRPVPSAAASASASAWIIASSQTHTKSLLPAPVRSPPPLLLLLSGCLAKSPQAAKIKFSKQHAHHAYRHTDNIYDGGTDTDDDECPLEATAMNPYEYESTLDCRDVGGGPTPAHAHPHAQGRTLPMSGHGRPTTDLGPVHGSQTLQHQNQQNLQAAQAAAQSSHYDYEYQHLAHRPPDTANNTAQRTHGRQGEWVCRPQWAVWSVESNRKLQLRNLVAQIERLEVI